MNILSGLDGLRTILGVAQPAQTPGQTGKTGSSSDGGSIWSDSATLSSAGSEVAQTAGESTVRMDKVASIKAALEAGTYDVSSSDVASRMVDSMLASGQ